MASSEHGRREGHWNYWRPPREGFFALALFTSAAATEGSEALANSFAVVAKGMLLRAFSQSRILPAGDHCSAVLSLRLKHHGYWLSKLITKRAYIFIGNM